MSLHGWNADAPAGVYKNHKLSAKIRMASIAETKFMQFTRPEPGYGKKKGESITLTRVSNVAVPSDDSLSENQRIPQDELSLSTQAITVVERGRSIPYTSFAIDLSHFDLENAIQMKLKDQLALRMDIAASAAFKVGQVKAIPDGISSLTFDTDGTASTAATVNMNLFHVEQLRDYAFGTLNLKPFIGDDYMCLISYKGARGIKSDPRWEDWQKYTDPSKKFNSEIGRMENTRFIEINHTSALSATLGTGSVLGEAVYFGADPVVMAVAEDPHLVAETEDFGRQKAVAWYGIYGFGQVWSDSASAGEARVIHVTSS